MTNEIVYKAIPLPLACVPRKDRGTPEEREARIRAHCERVHPQLAAIEQEESRVRAEFGCRIERARANSRKCHRKRRARELERARVVMGRRGT